MKIIQILILSFSIIQTSYSQTSNLSKLLVKEWQIDVQAMRPILNNKLRERHDIDDSNISEALDAAIEKIEGMTVVFKSDGTYEKRSPKGTSKSSWSLNEEKNEIIITSDATKETRVLRINEVSDAKLIIEASNGTLLVFKSL